MPLDRKKREQIVQSESSKFLDSQFGQLDLSGSPDLQSVPLETFEREDKHGFHNVDVRADLSGLRKFLNAPDSESLARVASETNDPEIVAHILDEQAARVAKQFMARNPQYLSDDTNLLRIVNALSKQFLGDYFEDVDEGIAELAAAGFWTVANLEAAYRDLLSDGLLRVPANIPRNLNSFERVEVIRLCQQGQIEAALQKYLAARIGDEDPGASIALDPDLVPICNEAILFCFEHAAPDYTPTQERREFIRRFAAGRPLSVQLVSQAWAECKRQEALQERNQIIGLSESPTTREAIVENLDEMSDDEISNLYRGTRKHIARTSRTGPGVLA